MTTNPVTQISKIQVRRGAESDLPGAPISQSPIAFSKGLDIGEMALTTDTNRVFIGADPAIGNANYDRVSFPYQNVEILTETSPIIETLVQRYIADISATAFHTASLAANVTAWTDITTGTAPFEMIGATVSATIEYFAFDTNAVPVKQGTLKILHAGGSAQIVFIDDSISARRTDITGASAYDPSIATDELIFQAYKNGDGAYRIQYQNLSTLGNKLMFRVTRPLP